MRFDTSPSAPIAVCFPYSHARSRKMLTTKLCAAGALLCATVIALPAHADDRDRDHPGDGYSSGLWGDLPFSDAQGPAVWNLIDDMNSQHLAFSVHDGDLKAGNGTPGSKTPTTCSNELYQQALDFLNALQAPAMFTPGDNDWTDCDRPANGGFSSLERLSRQRALFFSTNESFGKRRMRQEVQTGPLCLGEKADHTRFMQACSENRRWTV